MNVDMLKDLVAQGESVNLEFKKSTSALEAIGETLCGFLNSNRLGGKVIIGVTDKGEIKGQLCSDNTLKKITVMTERLEPAIYVDIEQVPIDVNNTVIIVLSVKSHVKERPYSYKGRCYYRNGSSTMVMPQNLKKQLLLAGMQDGHYEDIVTAHSDFSSIDDGLVKKVVAQGVEFNRLPQSALTESIQTVLQQRLYLMDNGYFTNAAYILFGRNLKKEYSQCFIKLAHFSGNTLLSTMLDHQQRYGNAFEVLAVAMRFVQNNMKVSSEFTADDIRRKDKPQIPVLAIRELIVNAICHRDYSDRYGEISLSIFSDRFEIWNNGKLHGGLTPEKLKVTHVSKRINPKIAEVFYFCGYIDRWGMGTLRVLEQCKKIGLPEPDFKEKDGGILVTIYFAERESTLEKSPQHVKYEGLTERQRLILECIWTDKEMKFPEIQKKLALNISDKTLRNELSILKELGLIELVGRGQYARWVVKTQSWPPNEV